MQYDFDKIIDRTGLDSIAYEAFGDKLSVGPGHPKDGFSPIPMWIADMNFETMPLIPQAIIKRASHPLYGYFLPGDEYYQGIINWHHHHHQIQGLQAHHITYHNGVLGGLTTAMRVLGSQGDKVLLHAPTYSGFTGTLENNGFDIVLSDLVQDQEGVWRMDLADMERKIKNHKIHLTIFCSPHNPTGRVWSPEEIAEAMALFEKYQVYVISDEIWSDLVLPGYKHYPTQTISAYAKDHTVALYAPSKTFNLAGLVGAYSVIYNSWLKDRVDKEASLSHYNTMNVLSMHAQMAAYCPTGISWLKDLRQIIARNIEIAVNFVNDELPGVTVTKPQGTYMIFIDCHQYLQDKQISMADLIQRGYDVGVGWQPGEVFNAPNHIRLNLALPKPLLEEALKRMKQHIFI